MSATSVTPRLQFRRLYGSYREAWKQFCAEVEALQSLSPDTVSTAAIENARKRVRDAETLYRNRRDEFADYMIATSGAVSKLVHAADGAQGRRFQLEQLAHQFWQDGGRKEGSAEADWYRAEALLRRTAS